MARPPCTFGSASSIDASRCRCYQRSRVMWRDLSELRNVNPSAVSAAIVAHKEVAHRQERALFFQLPLSAGTCSLRA